MYHLGKQTALSLGSLTGLTPVKFQGAPRPIDGGFDISAIEALDCSSAQSLQTRANG